MSGRDQAISTSTKLIYRKRKAERIFYLIKSLTVSRMSIKGIVLKVLLTTDAFTWCREGPWAMAGCSGSGGAVASHALQKETKPEKKILLLPGSAATNSCESRAEELCQRPRCRRGQAAACRPGPLAPHGARTWSCPASLLLASVCWGPARPERRNLLLLLKPTRSWKGKYLLRK